MNDIQQMSREGLSISRIKQLTGYDRKTIRKYLDTPEQPTYGPRAPRPRHIDAFVPYLTQRLSAGVWNAAVLLRELQERGYTGGYTAVKDYLQPLREEAHRVAVRRFETPPGQQAQMDWGDLGDITFPEGERRSLSGFVLTLGYSRAMYADVACDQKLGTLLLLHERAFAALGGVPQEILYDNMKTVVVQTLTAGVDERGEIRLHPTFADFARYWGFVPRLCRPYRPQTKGKVESSVKYVRRNFLCGRHAEDEADLQRQLFAWTAEVANQRIHGTTHRCVHDAWQEEQPLLQSVAGRPPYRLADTHVRRVSWDGYVAFRTNSYPAPWQAVGKEVFVRLEGEQLQIVREEALLATHTLLAGRYQRVEAGELHAGMPFGPSRSRKKTMLHLTAGAPVVEQRSLEVYARAAGLETWAAGEYERRAEGGAA